MGLRERVRRLTASTEELHDERLRRRCTTPGCTPIGEVQARERVRVNGEIQATKVAPRGGTPSFRVTIDDGTGELVAVFTGRNRLPGLTVGRLVVLEGVPRREGNRAVILNPAYTLLP